MYDSVNLRRKNFLALEENDENIESYYYMKFKNSSSDFLCSIAKGKEYFLYFWKISTGKIYHKLKLDYEINSLEFSLTKKNEFLIVGN